MITLLTGPNTYAIATALREATRGFDGAVERYEGGELETRHLADIFTGVSLFSPRRLVVLRDVASHKPLWGELERWVERTSDETAIYLVEPNPDKRTKTFKLLQKHATIYEHKELAEADLVSWLTTHARDREIDLQPDVARYFVSYVGRDQWRLHSEFEKLLLARQPVTQRLIREVTEPYPEASAFELLDAVFTRDVERTESLLETISARDDPFQFLGLLASQTTVLYALTAAGSKRPADIARDLSVHPFVVSKLSSVARQLGRSRVESLIEALAWCDERIKTTAADPWQQLRLTLLTLCTAK